ncbi:M48 family metalloprotease [Marinactinospora rubrisoli]|uniref:M48 family metalloprotease n=1 Tax=Marinactinospora rubrisoli TaxID=2715399 RepID=A0ABW2KFS1_9ACTN
MPNPAAEAATPGRYDPFLLPSATSIRFFLLILAAAVGAMYIGFFYLPLAITAGAEFAGLSMADCEEAARTGAAVLSDRAVLDGFLDCYARNRGQTIAWMMGAGPIWALLTVVGYLLWPIALELRLRPRRAADDPVVRAARAEAETGLDGASERVRVLTTQGRAGGARVFGALGRYRLAVDSSLLAERADGGLDEPPRAVLRHEIAHLRNRDVDLTYLTMAAWWASLLLIAPLLPSYTFLTIVALATGQATGNLVVLQAPLFMGAIALLLLQAIRARVLRTREHYADVRAAYAWRSDRALRAILSRPGPASRAGPWRRWWRGLRSYHPSPAFRLRMLDDPRRLATVSLADLAFAGILLGALQAHLGTVGRVATDGGALNVGGAAVAMLLGAPVGALVAAVGWNAVHADPDGARRWSGPAAVLAGGTLLGYSLPVVGVGSWLGLLAAFPVQGVVSYLVLWGLCVVLLRWAALSARVWLAATERRRAACAAGLCCAAVVFGCVFALWVIFDSAIRAGPGGWDWYTVRIAAMTAVLSWALPVAVGCAAVFTFTGLILRPDTRGPAVRPLLPVIGAAAVAAAQAALLAWVTVGQGVRATGPGFSTVLDYALACCVLLAMGTSAGLGAWAGGRGRLGAALCAGVVFAFTVVVLLPPVILGAAESVPCLAADPSLSCWGGVGLAMLTSYSVEQVVWVALPLLLGLCAVCAAAGSGLRRLLARRGTPPHADRAPRRPGTGHAVSTVLAFSVPLAVVALSAIGAPLEDTALPAERRAELAARVEPESVGRDATCETALATWAGVSSTSTFRLDVLDPEDGVATLAASRDPVLAAFGRGFLDGADVDHRQLFYAAARYCEQANG